MLFTCNIKHLIYSGLLYSISLVLLAPITFGQSLTKTQIGASSFIVAGLHMDVTYNIKNNLEQILTGIRKAALESASFLVIPESSLSGYTNYKSPF